MGYIHTEVLRIMNPESLEIIFRSKNLRRKELVNLPLVEKMRIIEALRNAGLSLRRMRPEAFSKDIRGKDGAPAPVITPN